MRKVFFFILTAGVAYFSFLKISERIGTQAIWHRATDEVKFSE